VKDWEVIPGVYRLSGFWGAGIWGANVYLLVDNDLTLVDTGFKGRARQIMRNVMKLGYSPSEIVRIIITHHHADHIGSLAVIKNITQAKVIAHPADTPYIDGRLPQPGPTMPRWLSKALASFQWMWALAPWRWMYWSMMVMNCRYLVALRYCTSLGIHLVVSAYFCKVKDW